QPERARDVVTGIPRLVGARTGGSLLEASKVVAIQDVQGTLLAHNHERMGNGGCTELVPQHQRRARADVFVSVAQLLRIARCPEGLRRQLPTGGGLEPDGGLSAMRRSRRTPGGGRRRL